MTAPFQQLQIERLIPAQIDAALEKQPIAYLPLGTYEFHGAHLPIGLDSLTAQRLCLEAAQRLGGLVFPPFYYGWGNNGYPWNIMTHDDQALVSLLLVTLQRLQDMGVQLTILFSGHGQTEQVDLLKKVESDWRSAENGMHVLALSFHDAPNLPIQPDHAALFETSLLAAFEPQLVHIDQLPDMESHPANDPGGDTWGAHRGDPQHTLYGIFGTDPRLYDERKGNKLGKGLIDWFTAEIRSRVAKLNEIDKS